MIAPGIEGPTHDDDDDGKYLFHRRPSGSCAVTDEPKDECRNQRNDDQHKQVNDGTKTMSEPPSKQAEYETTPKSVQPGPSGRSSSISFPESSSSLCSASPT